MSTQINIIKQKWEHSHLYSTTITKIRYYGPSYFFSLMPILSWLPNYNMKYLIGDVIAGLTVGIMMVPQSLAYAKLANLPVQFGLYTGFFGTLVYCLTGTARELSVGPTAVLSLLVGKVISSVAERSEGEFDSVEVAVALGFMLGIIGLVLGFLRLGSVMDLIPMPVILGFTTGAAFTIILTQLPNLLGIPNISTNQPNPLIVSSLFISLPKIKHLDLILGLSSVFLIILINTVCKKMVVKYPWLKYVKASANGIAVTVFTLISYIIFLTNSEVDIKIIKEVPSGFTRIGVPTLNIKLISSFLSELGPIVIIAILEHIAVAKSLSRQSGYQINSSQEILTIGIINTFGSFFSAFPSTGSFSRSAVMSQSGAQTPLASAFSSIIVLMALSFLTPAFYYIPNACLSAIIVISASSLVVGVYEIKKLAKSNPTDSLVVVVAAIATFLAGSEVGIAIAVGLSFIILLYKLSRPALELITPINGDNDVFITQDPHHIQMSSPIPGILIFKPTTWLIFPNIEYIKNLILNSTLLLTRSPSPSSISDIDTKLWSDDLAIKGQKLRDRKSQLSGIRSPDFEDIPYLRSLVIDLSNVNYIDASGLQGLVDLKAILIEYVGCEPDGTYKDTPLLEAHPCLSESHSEHEADEKKEFKVIPNKFDMLFVTLNVIVIDQLSKAGLLNSTSDTVASGEIKAQTQSSQTNAFDPELGTNYNPNNDLDHNTKRSVQSQPISSIQMTVKMALSNLT